MRQTRVIALALCLALVWVTWRDGLLNLLKTCRREINVQLRGRE